MAKYKVTLVGLSGTNGSGKDTVGQILADHYNWLFVSVTEILREEVRHRQLPVIRANLRLVSAEWRRQQGLAVLIDKAWAMFADSKTKYSGLVMASLRNPGEVDRLHELGGKLIWIDADPKVRYQRVINNAHLRGRSEEDDQTYQQFLSVEAAEMTPPKGGDSAELNMSAVRQRADIMIDNTDLSLKQLTSLVADRLGLSD